MIFFYCIRPNSYKKISILLENTCVDFPLHFFLRIYNKFVKFFKDLVNISIILKILIREN
jgi:hypothetical protein